MEENLLDTIKSQSAVIKSLTELVDSLTVQIDTETVVKGFKKAPIQDA
ncbi:MAG TPA: hypothetical protein VGM95_05085 [Lactobacillaceae bacterium]|jgi:hypothetical protein